MNRLLKNITSTLMVTLLSVSALAIPVMALDEVVDTTPIEGIIVTTPVEGSEESENTTPTEPGNETETEPGDTSSDESSMIQDGLKDDLYEGNILKEGQFDLDSMFDRLITKLRGLVENIRKLAVPILVISWMVLFFVAVARIVTGERGASARLVSGLFWITFAYCGIVSAEAILYALVKFFVGA